MDIMNESTRLARAQAFRARNYTEDRTHEQLTLDYLTIYGTITPLEALEGFGCLSLASRIYDLKRKGAPIVKALNKGRKHYAIYELIDVEAEHAESVDN